jgi:hypothetical protein
VSLATIALSLGSAKAFQEQKLLCPVMTSIFLDFEMRQFEKTPGCLKQMSAMTIYKPNFEKRAESLWQMV